MKRLLLLATLALAIPASEAAAATSTVNVMTRNVYLGADLTPGVEATNFQALVNAAGTIINETERNSFSTRAKGLAAEILREKPDLVGIQEGALWRDQPCTAGNPLPPTATNVRYDSVAILMAELNRAGRNYRLVISKPEFDFAIWANMDGNEQTANAGCQFGGEIIGRLTMHDAILARVGRVRTSRPRSGTFKTLMQVKPAGANYDVVRGWTAVDAVVKRKRFRFVNTHLEAFDSGDANATNTGRTVGRGQIREAQARELFRRGGPATGRLPVVLLGDFNSDAESEVQPGDGRAFRAITRAGFVRRARSRPYSCCIDSSLLTANGGGNVSDFDHTVDHVFADAPRKITLIRSTVTGRNPVNGFWSSDHGGVFSSLRFR